MANCIFAHYSEVQRKVAFSLCFSELGLEKYSFVFFLFKFLEAPVKLSPGHEGQCAESREKKRGLEMFQAFRVLTVTGFLSNYKTGQFLSSQSSGRGLPMGKERKELRDMGEGEASEKGERGGEGEGAGEGEVFGYVAVPEKCEENTVFPHPHSRID